MYAANLQLNLPAYYDSSQDTTIVTIGGLTTAVPNYIKAYAPNDVLTEVNQTQRHSGKWDNGKYSLGVSDTGNAMTITAAYAKIDGLQVEAKGAGGYTNDGIRRSASGSGKVEVSNCIVKYTGAVSGANAGGGGGIVNYSGGGNAGVMLIVNNLVYGFSTPTGGGGLSGGIYGRWLTTYAYNNTVYNSDYGIITEANTFTAKNNLVQNCGDGYHGSFNASSGNNLSDLASDAPGTNSKNGVRVEFMDASSSDFRLKLSDKYARDAGADLSADTNYAFNTDVDTQARGKGLGWDIGADEAGAQIYYSVGQNTNDHKTGSPTVTVSGSTATFSEAQTAPNMGVGDVVTYGSNKCYIAGKLSQTAWSCTSATGTLPVATTTAPVASIAHAFGSLNDAFPYQDYDYQNFGVKNSTHLNTNNLVGEGYVLNIPCYSDGGPDSSGLSSIGYFTTGPNNYVRIYTPHDTDSEANSSQRHLGKWDDSKFVRQGIIATHISYFQVEGLQIKTLGSSGVFSNSPFYGKGQVVANNIIWNASSTYASHGVYWTGTDSEVKVNNNIIYGFTFAGSTGIKLALNSASVITAVYNNTVYGNAIGIAQTSNSYYSNNVSYNNGVDYTGTPKAGSTNNLSKDATANGSNAKTNQTVIFVNASSSDFHLSNTDTAARDAGASLANDPYLPFMTDIDGQMRPIGGVWDIGADEDGGSTRIRGGVKIDGSVKINKY